MKDETSARGVLRGLVPGLAYFAAVFAIGFALGTIRTLAIAPVCGELAAVVIELPVMLAAAWAICGWTIRRLSVPESLGARSVMGLTAFCCLMLGEMLLSILLSDRNVIEHLVLYREPDAQLGLAGQVLFGLFPLFRVRG